MCEEQVRLRKQKRRKTARAMTKGQEEVSHSPRGARESLWLENLIGNELMTELVQRKAR